MPLLRACSNALAFALDSNIPLIKADLFIFVLADGTTYYWTSYTQDLLFEGNVYSSRSPWLNRTKWNVGNTMEVPTMTVIIRALNTSFAGGASIKRQIINGLLDGATFTLIRVFMPTPGDVTTLGGMTLFSGVTADAKVLGTRAEITCKGKNNLLAQYAPRNVYQVTCLHAFCDAGCTLNRATFTTPFTVGTSGLSALFIPWDGSPPSNFALYKQGTLTMTSGDAAGSQRTIIDSESDGLTLSYPLDEVPAPGDTFTAFEGCDKTKDSGSGQSCTDRANTQNFFAVPFLPPPNSAY